ncbi:hypothetical protein C8F01DRAFT_262584 [Mycena amicta]|nr:hypothetical protein C8F01DRAFT_262584 [Mycena amicta]
MAAPNQDRISSLPHELLGEIFTECSVALPDAPLVLGAVSQLFRHIAYTTPPVWTHLQLDGTSAAAKKTTLWFAMSRVCRVTVRLDLAQKPQNGHMGGTESHSAIFDALRSHTKRIGALEIRVEDQLQAGGALSAIYSGVSPADMGLRALHLYATKLKATPRPLVFPAIPTIVDMETTNIALESLPSLNLGCLEHLRLVQPLVSVPLAPDHIVHLAHVAPQLRRLRIEARIAESPACSAETQLVPQLEELHLRANNLIPLLDRFVVPRLHTLYLDDIDGKRAGASEEVAGVLHRLLVRMELGKGEVTNNRLRDFELVGVAVDMETAMWRRCMQKMQAVLRFRVGSSTAESDSEEEVEYSPPAAEVAQRRRSFTFGFGWAGDLGNN